MILRTRSSATESDRPECTTRRLSTKGVPLASRTASNIRHCRHYYRARLLRHAPACELVPRQDTSESKNKIIRALPMSKDTGFSPPLVSLASRAPKRAGCREPPPPPPLPGLDAVTAPPPPPGKHGRYRSPSRHTCTQILLTCDRQHRC